jgi:hypothetical protein
VSSRSDPCVIVIAKRESVSEDACGENFDSLETFWGSRVIKKGLVKICKRCHPAVNEVSFVAY